MFAGHVGHVVNIAGQDGVHRIPKARALTTRLFAPAKRDDAVCATGYSTCADSLGGDCCPNGYSCASVSCFATTSGPSICNGMVGWYGCQPVDGGVCLLTFPTLSRFHSFF